MLSRQAIRSIRAAAPARTVARAPARSYAAAAPSASASASANQDVKPPVAVYGIDGTYATALVRFRTSIHPPSHLPPLERPFRRRLDLLDMPQGSYHLEEPPPLPSANWPARKPRRGGWQGRVTGREKEGKKLGVRGPVRLAS